jgi:hypothetical protein
MSNKTVSKCERCANARTCQSLNPYTCNDFSPEINSVSCFENNLVLSNDPVSSEYLINS